MQARTATAAAAPDRATEPQGIVNDGRELPGLTKTPWGTSELAPRYSQLASDIEADVCVVGGGIVALSVAYKLQKSGERSEVSGRRRMQCCFWCL